VVQNGRHTSVYRTEIFLFLNFIPALTDIVAGVAQSVYCLATDWTHRRLRFYPRAEAKEDFSSNLCVQTSSEAHSASCPMGTVGPIPGVKRGQGVTLTIHSHLVPWSRMSRSYTSSPPSASMACSGTALLLSYY
jgi:hypothetical protein